MSEKNIPFIHNYCDRWCERCTFNSRCAVAENEQDMTPEEKDINNEAFWNRIAQNFAESATLLHKAAAEHGIDLTVTEAEQEKYSHQEAERRKAGREHPIGEVSMKYATEGMKWFKKGVIKERLDELVHHATLGILNIEEAKQQIETINECVSVIQWYLHFIHVKFMRALMGKSGDDFDLLEELPPHQRDYNGSAKIALLSIDRSLQAWVKLYDLIPSEEDTLIRLMGLLQKTKSLAEKEFPDAYVFIRPGFDEKEKYDSGAG